MRRPARPDDLPAVHAIYVHEAVSPYLTYEPMPLAQFEPLFEEMLRSGGFHVWEVDGGVAGFYRVTRYPGRASHVAMLGTLAVDPRRHGQGIAQAMIGDVLGRLRADGVRRVELYAESDNPRALRFYARMGFVHEGTLRRFYKRAGDQDYVDEHVLGLLFD